MTTKTITFGRSSRVRTPVIGIAFLIASGGFLMCQHPFSAALALLGAMYLYPLEVVRIQQRCNQFLKRHNLNSVMAIGAIIGLLSGLLFLFAVTEPAQAQFFIRGETWLTQMFPGIATNVMNLIFGTIRALFVLYLLFGLLQVINAARQGEEWKELAKVPFMVLLVGVLGDMLIGVITGT